MLATLLLPSLVRKRLHIFLHAWFDDLLKPALSRPLETTAFGTSGRRLRPASLTSPHSALLEACAFGRDATFSVFASAISRPARR